MITSRDLEKHNVYRQISIYLQPHGLHVFWKGDFTENYKPIAEVLYNNKFSDINPLKVLWCYKYWKYPHKNDILTRRKSCRFHNCVNPECFNLVEWRS